MAAKAAVKPKGKSGGLTTALRRVPTWVWWAGGGAAAALGTAWLLWRGGSTSSGSQVGAVGPSLSSSGGGSGGSTVPLLPTSSASTATTPTGPSAQTTAALGQQQKEIGGLLSALEGVQSEIGGLKASSAAALGQQQQALSGLGAQLSGLQAKLSSLGQQQQALSGLAATLGQQQQALTSLGSEISGLQAKLATTTTAATTTPTFQYVQPMHVAPMPASTVSPLLQTLSQVIGTSRVQGTAQRSMLSPGVSTTRSAPRLSSSLSQALSQITGISSVQGRAQQSMISGGVSSRAASASPQVITYGGRSYADTPYNRAYVAALKRHRLPSVARQDAINATRR
jgi:hypothetical protein